MKAEWLTEFLRVYHGEPLTNPVDAAHKAIAAVAPMIRAAEREEIAAVVQARGCLSDPCCDDIAALAAAIRTRTSPAPGDPV